MEKRDKEVWQAQSAIRAAAADPYITKEEILMLHQDWNDWEAEDKRAEAYQRAFERAEQSSLHYIKNLQAMITAGDRANKN